MGRPIETASYRVHTLSEAALDFGISIVLNLAFVVVIGLVLWPLGMKGCAISLARGYLVFWIITVITALVVHHVQRLLRADTDTRIYAYIISNLGHSFLSLSGWSAFATLTVRSYISSAPAWVVMILWVVGLFSSVMAFIVITTFYRGSVYRLINISIVLVSFSVFAFWPASAGATFGWFFNLF